MNDYRDPPCPQNEQAVGWTLHALEPDEEVAVLMHLPRCSSCRAAAHDAEQVLALLGASVEQVDPPPSLRDSLLARAAQTPQVSGAASRPYPRIPAVPPAAPPLGTPPPRRPQLSTPPPASRPAARRRPREDAPAAARPPDRRPPRRPWTSTRGRRLLASSLALVAVLAVGGLAVRTIYLEQEGVAQTAQAQAITELLQQLDRPGSEYAVMAAEDGSTAAAVLVTEGERRVFTVGLPANEAERETYVLWGLRAGSDPQPLGTFDVAPADRGVRTVGSGSEASGFGQYAISREPGRVAPASPSSVVASGQVGT